MKVKNIFICVMFFNLGLSLVAFLNLGFVFCGFSGVVLAICVCLVLKNKLNWKMVCLSCALFIFGVLRFLLHDYSFRLNALKFDGSEVLVRANVIEVRKFSSGKESYVFKVKRVDDENLILPIYVNVNGSRNFQFDYGDEVLAQMKLVSKENSGFNYGFSQSKTKSIYLNGKILQLFYAFEGSGFFVKFFNARMELLNAIERFMDEPASCLASALFLGQSRKLPYYLQRGFSRCGLAHIFAVSGLHISILFACLVYLLKRLRLSREISFLILTVFLFCYNLLLGFCISAIRASVMNGVYYIGRAYRKKLDVVHLLGFTAALILLIWPNAIFSCSFMLSFSSCLGIALFFKSISKFISEKFLWFSGWKKAAIDLFAISISAMVFSSIFVVMFFGQISLIAPFVNMLVMPFVPMALVFSGFLAFSSACNLEFFAKFFAYCCEGIFFEIITLVNFFSKLPYCCLPMLYFIAPFILLALIVFLIFVFFYAKNLIFSKLVAFFCMLIIFVPILVNYAISFGASYVSFVGNGVGFSVIISSLDKIIVLCCGGGVGCEKQLCKFLDGKGISKIDFLIFLPVGSKHINYDVLTIVDCFKTFCVMMPKSYKNSALSNLLFKKETYLILQEQARFENFPIFVDFLSRPKGEGFNCYINVGGLDFAYCCSNDEFMQMQRLKFANIFIVDDEIEQVDDSMNFGFLISLKPGGAKHAKKASVVASKTTEFVIQGSYLKEGGL